MRTDMNTWGSSQYVYFSTDVPTAELPLYSAVEVLGGAGWTAGRYMVLNSFPFDVQNVGVRNLFQLTQIEGLLNSANTGGGQWQKTPPSHLLFCIGDSIMSPGYGGFEAMKPLLQNGARTFSFLGVAQPGTDTTSWLPSAFHYQTYTAPIFALRAAHPNVPAYCLIALGTNDSKTGTARTAAAYAANLSQTIAALSAQSIKTILTYGPPLRPGGEWEAQSNVRIEGYNAALEILADDANVFVGDREINRLLDPVRHTNDGVHPNAAGNLLLGQLRAEGVLNVLNPLRNLAVSAIHRAFVEQPVPALNGFRLIEG